MFRCPRCGMKLWAIPIPRRIRFHDTRHTTGTLLLKAGVPLAIVQKILRHSDPAITSEVYGHLDLEDMRAGINRLSFQPERNALPAPDRAQKRPPFAASLLLSSGDCENEGPGATTQRGGTPGPFVVGATGFEPATTCTPIRFGAIGWPGTGWHRDASARHHWERGASRSIGWNRCHA